MATVLALGFAGGTGPAAVRAPEPDSSLAERQHARKLGFGFAMKRSTNVDMDPTPDHRAMLSCEHPDVVRVTRQHAKALVSLPKPPAAIANRERADVGLWEE